jgi:hypothetical protein
MFKRQAEKLAQSDHQIRLLQDRLTQAVNANAAQAASTNGDTTMAGAVKELGEHLSAERQAQLMPKIKVPPFDSTPERFPQWWATFYGMVDSVPKFTNIEKLVMLQASLPKGEAAAEALAGFPLDPETYDEQISILKRRFGDRQRVLSEQLNTLLNRPAAKTMAEVARLVSFLMAMKRTLAAHGIDFANNTASHFLMATFERKLTYDLNIKWQQKIAERKRASRTPDPERSQATIDYGQVCTIDELLQWLETRVSANEAAKKVAAEAPSGAPKPQPRAAPSGAPRPTAKTAPGGKKPPFWKTKPVGKPATTNLVQQEEDQETCAMPVAADGAAAPRDGGAKRREKKGEDMYEYFERGCLGCGRDGHLPPECQAFKGFTLKEKWARLHKRSSSGQFCYRCFAKDHKCFDCPKGVCGVPTGPDRAACAKRHHPVLHRDAQDQA